MLAYFVELHLIVNKYHKHRNWTAVQYNITLPLPMSILPRIHYPGEATSHIVWCIVSAPARHPPSCLPACMPTAHSSQPQPDVRRSRVPCLPASFGYCRRYHTSVMTRAGASKVACAMIGTMTWRLRHSPTASPPDCCDSLVAVGLVHKGRHGSSALGHRRSSQAGPKNSASWVSFAPSPTGQVESHTQA